MHKHSVDIMIQACTYQNAQGISLGLMGAHAQVLVISFMASTLFVRTRMKRDTLANGQRYANYLFFMHIFFIVNGYSELPLTVRHPFFRTAFLSQFFALHLHMEA